MATHDYVISNASGAAVRADLNNALAAIVTNNSSATAPTTTYAYQWWADTGSSPAVMKLRNAANSAWITLFQLDGEWTTLALENGTAAAPSIYFKDSGTDTGIYSPGADQVAISTNGQGRLFVDSSGRLGIGTGSPGTRFDVISTASASTAIARFKSGTAAGDRGVEIASDSSSNVFIQSIKASDNTSGYQLCINPSGGNVGIGSSTPDASYRATIAGSRSAVGPGIYFSDTDASPNNYALYINGSKNFVIRDATNSSDRFTVDTSGRILVGTSTSASAGNASVARIQVVGNSTDAAASSVLALNRGEAATSITSGEAIGNITFGDSSGNEFGLIQCIADANAGSGDYPGRLVFSTTADGASSPTERAKIDCRGFFKASNNGTYINSSGTYHEFSNNTSNDAIALFRNTGNTTPYGVSIDFSNAAPNDATRYFITCGDSAVSRFVARSNGGLANYQANNVNLSDRNAKKDITPAAGTWDCIKEWEIVNYRYKDQPDDADLNLGVIAQQVAESCPEVITVFEEAKDDQPEKLGIKEQQMYWMAIKALQEAQVRIEALETEVAALKAQ